MLFTRKGFGNSITTPTKIANTKVAFYRIFLIASKIVKQVPYAGCCWFFFHITILLISLFRLRFLLFLTASLEPDNFIGAPSQRVFAYLTPQGGMLRCLIHLKGDHLDNQINVQSCSIQLDCNSYNMQL